MKQLNKYADKQFTILLKQLGMYKQASDPETLHRIRIAIKKIKSLFRLINFCRKNFNYSREYRPLRKIFREAGAIRDLDVTNKLFSDNNINLNDSNNIGDREKLNFEFKNKTDRYIRSIKKKHNKIRKSLVKVSKGCYNEFIKTKESVLKELLNPGIIESNLHEVRKVCKEIIYLSEMSKQNKKYLNTFYEMFQDAIGKWHDKKVLIAFLKRYDSQQGKSVIKKIESEITGDLETLKNILAKRSVDIKVLNPL